jgi:hypothetical protein
MKKTLSKILDIASDYLARRKGLLPLLGILLVLLNLVLQIVPGTFFLKDTDLFLHIGLIVSVLGIMLAWAL